MIFLPPGLGDYHFSTETEEFLPKLLCLQKTNNLKTMFRKSGEEKVYSILGKVYDEEIYVVRSFLVIRFWEANFL